MAWRGRVEMVIHVVDGVDMVGLLHGDNVSGRSNVHDHRYLPVNACHCTLDGTVDDRPWLCMFVVSRLSL